MKKRFVLIAILLLAVVLYARGYYIKNLHLAPAPSPTSSPVTSQPRTASDFSLFSNQYDFAEEIVKGFNVLQKYEGNLSVNKEAWVWWLSPDNLNIINKNETGLEYAMYECGSDYKDHAIFKKTASILSTDINKIMIPNGFSLDVRNSSSSLEDDRFYDYIQAYEKDNLKCTLVANPDCSTFAEDNNMHYTFSFTCTNNYDSNYQEQSPYLKDLDIQNAIIHVAQKSDDFVKLNVNHRRTGRYTIAKLIDNKWQEIYSGQDNPSCAVIEQYQVPKEMYGICF